MRSLAQKKTQKIIDEKKNALMVNKFFSDCVNKYLYKLKELEDILSEKKNTVVYETNAHAITTVNMENSKMANIKRLYDINLYKNGKLTPLSLIPIEIPSQNRMKDHDNIINIASLHQDDSIKVFSSPKIESH
jgi:hypothetical protein